MVKLSNKMLPGYSAKRLRRANFSFPADVHIYGNVEIKERLVVGGNLLVEGTLFASEIYCVGKVIVKGNIEFREAYVGIAIHTEGWICGESLDVGLNAEYIASMLQWHDPHDGDEKCLLDRLVLPNIAVELEEEREERYVPALIAKSFCDLCVLKADGNVDVGGFVDLDIGNIYGNLTAKNIFVDDDLFVGGYIHTSHGITVHGYLHAVDIECFGNLIGYSSVFAEGSVNVRGFINSGGELVVTDDLQAGRWIAALGEIRTEKFIKVGECVVSDERMQVGNDYGILAGLCFPRSSWPENGFVSAPIKPKNILSRKFISDITYDMVLAKEAERNWEYFWETTLRRDDN